jgi:hypothetical protein
MESLHGRVVISTRETTKEMCVVVMAKCFGQMEATIKDSGSMEFSMDKV